MKLLSLLILIFSFSAWSATCTNTTRNNYTTNQVLTSSALNTDFNQLVTKANAFDGGCVTAGTLESDALNTTQFAPLLKGIKEGCKVSYSSASQLSIGKCLAAVNGAFVSTTTPTTVAFGCTSCSSETAATPYYVYISTGSTGTTLTPLILSTAPNEDGYDNSGNKVLASFYNDASSDISSHQLYQWKVNSFEGSGKRPYVHVDTPSGYGSTNTKIPIFTGVRSNHGNAITYATSATAGASFTINEDGIYSITFNIDAPAAATHIGSSLNGTALTTSVESLSIAQGFNGVAYAVISRGGTYTLTRPLTSGDVIRPHADGGTLPNNGLTYFQITQVSR